MKKALIAMSGGVDSSVAALLMQQKGYECVGATMKLFENEQAGVKREKTCCSLDDVEDARSVAYRLHMPYYVFNFTANFEKEVMDRFVCAYEKGWTPNPCIDCNRYLKFEKLYLRMQEMQMDTIVTGHYARVVYDEASGRYLLKKGLDNSKDQSYVLYNLTQEQLAHTQFPVGELSKHEVREIAEANGFINADKPDSQDICFVPDGDYAAWLEQRGDAPGPGDIIYNGAAVARHGGIHRFTLGQRRGLGYAAGKRVYVSEIRPGSGEVVLADGDGLFSDEVAVRDMRWLVPEPETPFDCQVRVRHSRTLAPARAYPEAGGRLRLVPESPLRAPTPGQAAALYLDGRVLGGGFVSAARPHDTKDTK